MMAPNICRLMALFLLAPINVSLSAQDESPSTGDGSLAKAWQSLTTGLRNPRFARVQPIAAEYDVQRLRNRFVKKKRHRHCRRYASTPVNRLTDRFVVRRCKAPPLASQPMTCWYLHPFGPVI